MSAKTKRVQIEVDIPAGYKFVARNPWGKWVAFKREPVLVNPTDHPAAAHWDTQPDELELAPGLENTPPSSPALVRI